MADSEEVVSVLGKRCRVKCGGESRCRPLESGMVR
jgi:hypothetical protein